MRPPRTTSKANVFMHSMGYFSKQLTLQEKNHFIRSIERFKDKKIPSRALLAMLQSWAVRFGEDYVKNQTFFEPFSGGFDRALQRFAMRMGRRGTLYGPGELKNLLRMSNYEKGDWCRIWDSLYWRFLYKHRERLSKNPRIKPAISNLIEWTQKNSTII